MYLEANLADSAPNGSDFSLALLAVRGALIPDVSVPPLARECQSLTSQHKGNLGVLLWHEHLEPGTGGHEVNL